MQGTYGGCAIKVREPLTLQQGAKNLRVQRPVLDTFNKLGDRAA